MRLAAVLVHYHTPELLPSACAALVRDAGASGIELEGVVVDNGSRPEDREIFRSLPFRRLDPGRNLGYAGGVNLGIRETSADLIAIANTDVEVLPGCLAALSGALGGGALDGDALGGSAAAAGPRFYWDREKRFLLPPTEPVSRGSELLRTLAERSNRWASLGRRAWRRHVRRYWLAATPFRSYDLSGALLAIRRSAWRQVGPFDEGYRLYFEENDWLLRLRAAGLEARFVPAAEAVHLFAQSVIREPRAESWFAESNRRFRRRAFGRAFTGLVERLSRRQSTPRPEDRRRRPGAGPASGAQWLEVSATPKGYPAAGRRLSPESLLGPEPSSWLGDGIWRRLAPGAYCLRTVDGKGRDLEARSVRKR